MIRATSPGTGRRLPGRLHCPVGDRGRDGAGGARSSRVTSGWPGWPA